MNYSRFCLFITLILLLSSCAGTKSPISPAEDYSPLAKAFLRDCVRTDVPFPPQEWSSDDLRAAALEVLDVYENGFGEEWTVYFCLITLGYTMKPADLPRILAYEEIVFQTVLQALRGFAHPDAIEVLLKGLKDESAANREYALHSLMAINFRQLVYPEWWIQLVRRELIIARDNEEFDFLREEIIEAIEKLEE